jgi:tetratricopeptide (TPR) repeat protein
MSSVSKEPSNGQGSSQGTRLDGWKEIATYLGRAERTAKRWEAQRGLPTHRIPGEGRRAVFAYSAELDEWLRSSGARDEPEAPELDVDIEPSSADKAQEAPGGKPEADSETLPQNIALESTVVAEKNRPRWIWPALAAVMLPVIAAAWVAVSDHWKTDGSAKDNSASGGGSVSSATPAANASVSSSADKAMARELYLKGRYEWNQRTPDSLNRAVDSFTQAIVHDPRDAEAYVGLAETYALLREYTPMPDSEAFSRSLAAAKKAVELDDSLAEAHRALAYAEMYGSWDFADAEKQFRRAIELNPRDPVARHWYANAFGVPGRFDESLRQISIAQSLDPGSHAILADKGWMLFLAGRRDEGIRTLREVEEVAPGFLSPHSYLMQVGLELRDYRMFLDEGEKMATTRQDSAWQHLFAAARKGYARGGERGLLQAMHDEAPDLPASYASSTIMAKVCIFMGRNDEALQILEEQYNRRDPNVLSCFSQPAFGALRDEPRYKALVAKINFPLAEGAGRGAV